jgi:PilZ domain
MANSGKIFFLNIKPEASKDHMSADDQRASQRFAHQAAVIIENCDSATYTYGRMYNYSAGGLYFESDIAFRPGTKVRVSLEKADSPLGSAHFIASVKWCEEITAAVVLYDYGIGIEFDRLMNLSAGNGKFTVIEGGGGHAKP